MILILFYFSFISLEDLDCCNQSWRLIAIFPSIKYEEREVIS